MLRHVGSLGGRQYLSKGVHVCLVNSIFLHHGFLVTLLSQFAYPGALANALLQATKPLLLRFLFFIQLLIESVPELSQMTDPERKKHHFVSLLIKPQSLKHRPPSWLAWMVDRG